jgi:arylsulfatase A-like enzyme
LIVFTAGNGAAQGFPEQSEDNSYGNMGRKGSWIYFTERWAEVSNAPLSLWKAKTKEGGISVPAIVRLPGQRDARPISHAPATAKDIVPTILDVTGIAVSGARYRGRDVVPVSGRSMLPLLKGQSSTVHPPDAVFADESSGEAYVRQGEWKAVLMTQQNTTVFERGDPLNAEHIALLRAADMAGAAKWREKYPGRWYLYDIANDRGETTDLAQFRPEILRRMQGLYETYRKENGVVDP